MHAYPCVPLCTPVYPCVPLCTRLSTVGRFKAFPVGVTLIYRSATSLLAPAICKCPVSRQTVKCRTILDSHLLVKSQFYTLPECGHLMNSHMWSVEGVYKTRDYRETVQEHSLPNDLARGRVTGKQACVCLLHCSWEVTTRFVQLCKF